MPTTPTTTYQPAQLRRKADKYDRIVCDLFNEQAKAVPGYPVHIAMQTARDALSKLARTLEQEADAV